MYEPSQKITDKIKKIANNFGSKVVYIQDGGSACTLNELIEIDLSECSSLNGFLSLFFHELAHVYCYNKNLYEFYHKENDEREKYSYMKRYGLRAERFVDKIGEKLMKKYFPDGVFCKNYESEEDVKSFYSWCDEFYLK